MYLNQISVKFIRIRIKTFVLIIILSLSSCSPKTSKILGLAYEQSIELFGKESLDHYPQRTPNTSFRFNFDQQRTDRFRRYRDGFAPSEAVFICQYEERKYKSIKKQYSSYQLRESSDTCLIYIFPFADEFEEEYDFFSTITNPFIYHYSKSQKYKSYGIPVPLIDLKNTSYDIQDEEINNLTHVIIKSEPGNTDFKIHHYEAEWLPDGWKHGYSKGISFYDEKRIIVYWFIAW
nr:hypothetical protein [uncultured Carboxylicivirga sp.]